MKLQQGHGEMISKIQPNDAHQGGWRKLLCSQRSQPVCPALLPLEQIFAIPSSFHWQHSDQIIKGVGKTSSLEQKEKDDVYGGPSWAQAS